MQAQSEGTAQFDVYMEGVYENTSQGPGRLKHNINIMSVFHHKFYGRRRREDESNNVFLSQTRATIHHLETITASPLALGLIYTSIITSNGMALTILTAGWLAGWLLC